MSIGRIKSGSVFLVVLIAACIWLPRSGFPEDKRAGFYAGPLSVVVKTAVEKSKPASEGDPQQADGTLQKSQEVMRTKAGRSTEPGEENPLSSSS